VKMVSEYETILRLIETADPADAVNLSEIDARVDCFLKKKTFINLAWPGETRSFYIKQSKKVFLPSAEYTDSRDALRDIRPKRWQVWLSVGHLTGQTNCTYTKIVKDVCKHNCPDTRFANRRTRRTPCRHSGYRV
jgi:hypothetical protein